MKSAIQAIDFSVYPILLVDDEIERTRSLLIPLQRRGFALNIVATPEEAFARIAVAPVSIVISDERMPGTSGVAFLTELSQRHPHIVRILFTGFSDHETAVRAINQGNIFRYILKSQPVTEIAQILEEAVLHYAAAQVKMADRIRERNWDKAEAALNVLRDVRYDWGNIVLTQKINFQRLQDLLSGAEQKFSLDLDILKQRCESANLAVEESLKEYFHNSFLDSTLTEAEAFIDVDLRIPVQMAVNIVVQNLDNPAITVRFEIERGKTYMTHIQRDRIKAAVGLLLHNAIESIEATGTVEVKITERRPAGRRVWEVSVADTGKGIPEANRDKIFDPLFKTLDKQGHMGIGLTFVKSIAEDQGGTVHFESEAGKGSTFFLRVPLQREE